MLYDLSKDFGIENMIINIFDLIFKSNIFMMSPYHVVKSKNLILNISKVLAFNFKIMHHCVMQTRLSPLFVDLQYPLT